MNPQSPSLNPKSSYTDAPNLHPNLLLGSIHLLFWLFIHPTAWRNYVVRLDPTLSPNFTLASLRRDHWRSPGLRRLLIQGIIILPLLPALLTGLTLLWRGVPLDRSLVVPVMFILAIDLSLALMIGSVVSLAAGLVASVLIGLAVGVGGSISAGYLADIIVPAFMSVAIGAVGSVAASMAEPTAYPMSTTRRATAGLQMQLGSIMVGVLMGVGMAALIRLGLTFIAGLAIGLSDNAAYWLSRAIVVGISFGLALGWQRSSTTFGIIGGVFTGLVYGLVVSGIQTQFFQHTDLLVNSGLAIGLASGLLFGISFGVTVVLPFVLSGQIAGPWAGAWAAALGSWGRHVVRNEVPLWPTLPLGLAGITLGLTQQWWRPLLLYPLVGSWNLILYQMDKRRTTPTLLRYHAAFWDEFQRLRLAGLDDHLLLVLDGNPEEGQVAMAYLRTRRQRWAAQAVQIELEARRMEQSADLASVGQMHHHLITGDLEGTANSLLRKFSHLSRDIEAALNQTTIYHQRLALNMVDDQLNNLIRELTVSTTRYAPRFYPVAAHWHQLVIDYLGQLSVTTARKSVIDNPYIVGVPLTEQQEIFVGRADIVARIEQLLLDRRRPPLLLYGQRRMGKTSLLRNLGRLLPRTIVPLFVDGQRIALACDYADLLHNLAGEVTKSAAQQRDLSLPGLDYETLAAKPFTRFNEWLDEVEQRLQAEGYHTALLTLDEFEMLDRALVKGRFDEEDLLSMLRHVIQHRTRFKVMLAGSHSLEEFQRWASYLINVQVVKIGYLAPEEAQQLIEQPIQNFGLLYEAEASQRVLSLTCGHPALVQLLCCELVSLKNEQLQHRPADEQPVARLKDVEEAVPRALQSGNFFFADIQQNQIDERGLMILRHLAGLGEKAVIGPADLPRHPGMKPGELYRTLNQLLQRELIEAVGNGFQFQVELMRRWFADCQDNQRLEPGA